MKNLLIFFFLFSLVCSTIFGQYRINKLNCNAHDYMHQLGDRYDPNLAGVASFLVPGLVQVVAGEIGRGLLFFVGYILSISIILGSSPDQTYGFHSDSETKSRGMLAIGVLGYAGTWIWSIFDAVKVLKSADAAKCYPGSDPIYNNDLSKWVRFANSVRLRLAMRIRYADESLSKATVSQCLSEPLMVEVAHDAAMIETEGNGNQWYNNRTRFPRVRMSSFLIDKLQSTDDPRLGVFVAKDKNGKYNGVTNGLTDVAFGNSGYDDKSDMGLALASKNSKLYLMTAA